MRTAILSDIHGNLTAFEAVLSDARDVSPDLVLHAGDLADTGSGPTEIVDRIRDSKWPGVMATLMRCWCVLRLSRTCACDAGASAVVGCCPGEIAAAKRQALGADRLEWLRDLPSTLRASDLAIVHATQEYLANATRDGIANRDRIGLQRVGVSLLVFEHTHRPRIRVRDGSARLLINAGTVGLP